MNLKKKKSWNTFYRLCSPKDRCLSLKKKKVNSHVNVKTVPRLNGPVSTVYILSLYMH